MVGGWKEFALIIIKLMALSGFQDQETFDQLNNHLDQVKEQKLNKSDIILTYSMITNMSIVTQKNQKAQNLLIIRQNDQNQIIIQDSDKSNHQKIKELEIEKLSSQQSPQVEWLPIIQKHNFDQTQDKQIPLHKQNQLQSKRKARSTEKCGHQIGQQYQILKDQQIENPKFDDASQEQNMIKFQFNIISIQISSSINNSQQLMKQDQAIIHEEQKSTQQNDDFQFGKDRNFVQSLSTCNKNQMQQVASLGKSELFQEEQKHIDSNKESQEVMIASQNSIEMYGDNFRKQNSQDNQIQVLAEVPKDYSDKHILVVLQQDPVYQHLRLKKVQKEEQALLQSLKLLKEINLNPRNKTTFLFYNKKDEKLILGLNDSQTQVYSIKDDQEWELALPNTPISIFNHEDQIYCGLLSKQVAVIDQKEYEVKEIIDTSEVVTKIIFYDHQDHQSKNSKQYLVFLEEKGWIEIYCLQNVSVIFTYQHKCQMDIKDGIQVYNSNQLCLGFSHLVQNAYKDGQLSFIKILMPGKDQQEFQIEELENVEYFNSKSVFCVSQISINCFIAFGIHKNIFFFNRKQPKSISQIYNPSGSINYNSLIKIDGFGEDRPYLIYRDSKSLGVINCKSLDVFTLVKGIEYARCGNLFCLEQSKGEKEGILSLSTMIYDKISSQRQIRIYSLNIDQK
ncbi:UNKNOWN [Stylonychia lemnae]|uniref:Uncharacterized protein n=1 Tax=Stylonychia lemnae TaxID=5949 RepID=A0A078B4L8_STYLE|nr:UNKNOWN [Stylonychia lemnae]|eukprot:CDW89475.1 UNKNOWN [Stylonychia lemnae]